jgi:DNA replication protein DnaC
MDEIKKMIDEIINDIQKRRSEIKEIPKVPERCESCYDGEFLYKNLPFICEFYGDMNCQIFREFLKEEIGKIFLNTSIDRVEEKAKLVLSNYLTNIKNMLRDGKGLNILGDIGTGKTSIIVLIIQKLFKEKLSFRYYHIKSFFDTQYENINFSHINFLFLDDIGVESLNEKDSLYLNYVIDLRYRFKLPVVITSNLSEMDIKKRYPRVFDRLFSRNVKIILEGTSRRKNLWNET